MENNDNIVKYYLVGNWMGPFRTESTTSTKEDFIKWAVEQGFTKRDDGKWKSEDNKGIVVFEQGNI